MNAKTIDARHLRASNVNSLLCFIAERGQHFFEHNNKVSHFEIDEDGKISWLDEGTLERTTAVRYLESWNHFSEEEQIFFLVKDLWDHIATGDLVDRLHFGPWPKFFHNGDPWGYGLETMADIRDAAAVLEIIPHADPAKEQ